MSNYASYEFIKLLNEERLREAQNARLASMASARGACSSQRPRFADQLRRLFVRQPAPSSCAC